jgi:hypothetical protein
MQLIKIVNVLEMTVRTALAHEQMGLATDLAIMGFSSEQPAPSHIRYTSHCINEMQIVDIF